MKLIIKSKKLKNKVKKYAINIIKFIIYKPIVINAYVKTKKNGYLNANWGDDLNFSFISYLTKRPIVIYFETPLASALRIPNYLCIGSTLNYLTTQETIVWGAGVIDENLELRKKPKCVVAVRGPLTRQYLLSRGIACPEVYGDPALLIPFFYKPKLAGVQGTGRIGLVPHYIDIDSPIVLSILRDQPEVKFINVKNYNHWTNFIDEICNCDVVFSSSLHGLIIAEAYGIPNYWINISNLILGNSFKFHDYYKSIGKDLKKPILIDGKSNLFNLNETLSWSQGRIDLMKLLEACPFEIMEPVIYEHSMDI